MGESKGHGVLYSRTAPSTAAGCLTPRTMQLLLVRHAHNDWLNDRLAGWTPGVHLNEEGRAAAAALAARLADHPIHAIYSSPLERARETAAAIAHPRAIAVETEPDLGEVRCGEWTGRRLEELAGTPLWQTMRAFPSGTRFPGGETLLEVQERALRALGRLEREHPQEVIVCVSHADVIKAVLAHYVGVHLDLAGRLTVSPASLSIVLLTPEGPRLQLFNDTGRPPAPDTSLTPGQQLGESHERE